MERKRIFVGVDPGNTGGIAAVDEDGNHVFAEKMPDWDEEKEMTSSQRLGSILRALDTHYIVVMCSVEKIHAIFKTSAWTMFKMGRALGFCEGVAGSTYGDTRLQLLPAKTWQSLVWLPEISKDKDLSAKEKSMRTFKNLYPTCDFREKYDRPYRGQTHRPEDHDGMVDALLIAEATRRKYLQTFNK